MSKITLEMYDSLTPRYRIKPWVGGVEAGDAKAFHNRAVNFLNVSLILEQLSAAGDDTVDGSVVYFTDMRLTPTAVIYANLYASALGSFDSKPRFLPYFDIDNIGTDTTLNVTFYSQEARLVLGVDVTEILCGPHDERAATHEKSPLRLNEVIELVDGTYTELSKKYGLIYT